MALDPSDGGQRCCGVSKARRAGVLIERRRTPVRYDEVPIAGITWCLLRGLERCIHGTAKLSVA